MTSVMTQEKWGDMETVAMKVSKCRLKWLGHVVRMAEDRTP